MKQGYGHTGPRDLDEGELKWQIRINLSDKFAAAARANPKDPVLQPLLDVLAKYDSHLKHQEMAFANFIPHFKNEEQPEHIAAIKSAYEALEEADSRDDVAAALEALQQYKDAVADFVERYSRLYLWTKRTMQKPDVQDKYSRRFSIYADGGQEIYDKEIADALEKDLKPLVENGMILNIDKFDSDPAHNPQAPDEFHMK